MTRNYSSFNTGFGFFKIIFAIVFLGIMGMLIFKGVLVSRAISSGKPLYEISVNRYDQVEEYITNEYNIDPQTKCITFKDEFGIKRTVCNNYTISQY